MQEIYGIYTGLKTQEVLNEIKYSLKYAQDNLKFFDSIKIPRIKETPMYGITKIKFVSDLSNAESIRDYTKYKFLK